MNTSKTNGSRSITKRDRIIGHNIKTYRILQGMQSPYLAEELDIKPAQYYKLESGKNHISLPRAYQMARIFGISIDRLVDEEHKFSKNDLKIIKPLIICFLRIENVQHRKNAWSLIHNFLDIDLVEYTFAAKDVNDTELLATSFLSLRSKSQQTQVMNFIYAIIKIK